MHAISRGGQKLGYMWGDAFRVRPTAPMHTHTVKIKKVPRSFVKTPDFAASPLTSVIPRSRRGRAPRRCVTHSIRRLWSAVPGQIYDLLTPQHTVAQPIRWPAQSGHCDMRRCCLNVLTPTHTKTLLHALWELRRKSTLRRQHREILEPELFKLGAQI